DEKYPRLSTVMTVTEGGQHLPTHVRVRGNWSENGEEVRSGTPASLPALKGGSDRLALTNWLVSPENPLTARVVVNRLGQEMFGRGLVSTPDDFGMRSQTPTHPELLDWLACEFRDHGWSVRHIVRLIATSATYRRSSAARPDLASVDPLNTF